MDRKEILEAALTNVTGKRVEDYGQVENNFATIANMWNAYLGFDGVDEKDVAAMMALLKIARIASGHGKSDNWVDLAGYAACGGELEGEEE